MPICKVCKQELEESRFGKTNRKLKSGELREYTDTTCMRCRREIHLSKPGKREIHREGSRAWRKKNKEGWKDSYLKSRYNISLDEYNTKRERQQYCCAICGVHETLAKAARSIKEEWRLQVDHCHSSGRIRDLLCTNCNAMIGKSMEDISILESAIKYLQKWK